MPVLGWGGCAVSPGRCSSGTIGRPRCGRGRNTSTVFFACCHMATSGNLHIDSRSVTRSRFILHVIFELTDNSIQCTAFSDIIIVTDWSGVAGAACDFDLRRVREVEGVGAAGGGGTGGVPANGFPASAAASRAAAAVLRGRPAKPALLAIAASARATPSLRADPRGLSVMLSRGHLVEAAQQEFSCLESKHDERCMILLRKNRGEEGRVGNRSQSLYQDVFVEVGEHLELRCKYLLADTQVDSTREGVRQSRKDDKSKPTDFVFAIFQKLDTFLVCGPAVSSSTGYWVWRLCRSDKLDEVSERRVGVPRQVRKKFANDIEGFDDLLSGTCLHHVELEKLGRKARTGSRSESQNPKELSMDARANHVGSARNQKTQHATKKIHADKFLKLVRVVFEALHYTRHTERGLLDNTLIVTIENVKKCGHNIPHNWEGILGNVATTVGGGRDSGSLSARGKEIERAESLFGQIDKGYFEELLAQYGNGVSIYDVCNTGGQSLHQVC
ncbi:hypothetical protein HG531_008572 [Fusarium graminearum]|nr:hypothetical protein HG531_008572 [Fusarium graminearum]